MQNKTKQQKSIADVLQQSNNQLSTLVKQVNQLQSLNQYLTKQLNLDFFKHCQIANLRDSTLVIFADNATWATQCRFHSPEIIKILKKNRQFNFIQNIQCSVRPNSKNK